MIDPHLEICEGPEAGRRLDLPASEPEVLVGRSAECAIVIAAPSVSRKHARLRRESERWVLEDLGSANGTQVNGERVRKPVVLRDGDRVTFGAVQTTFVDPPPPPPPPPIEDGDATIGIFHSGEETIAVPQAPPTVAVPRSRMETNTSEVSRSAFGYAPPGESQAVPAAEPGRPSIIELVAIGVASFLAVFGIGWLLL